MTAPTSPAYRICPHCQNVSFAQKEALFCVWCGTKLFDQCQECGKPVLHAHGRFCYHCGTQYSSRSSVHNGARRRDTDEPVIGIEQWAQEQERLFKAKFPPNEALVRNKV